jgi:hypothetical protein
VGGDLVFDHCALALSYACHVDRDRARHSTRLSKSRARRCCEFGSRDHSHQEFPWCCKHHRARRYREHVEDGYGQFGQNFTIEGLPDDAVCIGDRYQIGSALFEVTQPHPLFFSLFERIAGERDLARGTAI